MSEFDYGLSILKGGKSSTHSHLFKRSHSHIQATCASQQHKPTTPYYNDYNVDVRRIPQKPRKNTENTKNRNRKQVIIIIAATAAAHGR